MDLTPLLATGPIGLGVLVFGLFLPRLTLFVVWLMNAYPQNTLPDLLNFVCWLFVPRFLIAFYIYTDIGVGNVWFWAYIATGIAGMLGEGGYARHRIIRRTTVSRDGRTTTTVEEEEV